MVSFINEQPERIVMAPKKTTIQGLEKFDECTVAVSRTDMAVMLIYLQEYGNLREELNLNCSITEDIDHLVAKIREVMDQ